MKKSSSEQQSRIRKQFDSFCKRNKKYLQFATVFDIITNLGYQIKDDAKDFKDEIQPTAKETLCKLYQLLHHIGFSIY